MSFKKHLLRRSSILITILLLSLYGIAHQHSNPRKYYISNSGNDLNSGTLAAPFKTIEKVNNIHLKAGDVVFFKSGETFNGTLVIDTGITGTKAHPITISSYGKTNAIINAGNNNGIMVNGAAFIHINKLSFTGSGRKTGNTKDGVSIVNSDQILLNNLDIQGFQKCGLLIYASKNVVAENISSHDNGSAGITVEGPYAKRTTENIKIMNCRTENNPGDPTKLDNHSGNGIVVGNCKNILIDHCTATNNGWDMPRIGNGPVGIWAFEADHVIIQHCLAYRNKTSIGGADGGGFDLDGGVTNSIIQYCFSYDNQGAGYCIFQYWGASAWHSNVIRYNVSENDGAVSDSHAGLYIWNSSGDPVQFHDCDVYGNIIYNAKVAAVSFSEKSKNSGFNYHDNIFVARDELIIGKDSIGKGVFAGNDWWSLKSRFNIDGIKDLKTWAVKTGKEQKNNKIIGFNEDPGFENPGKSSITSASQLSKAFANYKMKNAGLEQRLNLLQLKNINAVKSTRK